MDHLVWPVMTSNDNCSLNEMPQEREVREALSSIEADSCPGSYGFGSFLFLACWNIVKEDVMLAVKDFFSR